MKKINLDTLSIRNDYELDDFIRGVEKEMEFIKYGNNYIVKNSNGKVVSEEEKLQLEKNEIILNQDDCGCEVERIKKVSKINKKLREAKKEVVDDTIEETNSTL